MQRAWRLLVVTVGALVCMLPAITVAGGMGSRATPHFATRSAVSGAVLRIGMPDASPTVDPAMVADDQSVEIANLLYIGLVRLDSKYRIVPAAAAHWHLSRDRKTWTFTLRRGLEFNNGQPLTASDFAFSITRSLNPDLKSPSAPTYLLDIEGASAVLAGKTKTVNGIKVVDPYTLQITSRWAVPYFLMELTYPTAFALDAQQMKKLNSVTSTSWYSNPVGSGPYRLKSWTQTGMTFVRNSHYHGSIARLKALTVSFQSIPASDAYQFVSHSLDVVGLCMAEGATKWPVGVNEIKMLAINGLYMNLKKKPFKSRGVRRALIMALDRNRIVQKSMGSSVSPFQGYVPFDEAGYDAGLKPLPYDRGGAKKLLASAGYPNGKGFPATTVTYADDPCNPSIAKLAQLIAKTWHKNLNIPVDTQALTVNTLLTKVQSDSLPLYMAGWSADYPDPHDWLSLQWGSGALNNNVHYRSARFDSLVAAADATWDVTRRMRLYNQAQQQLVSDAVWIPLYVPHRLVFLRPTVANLSVTGYGLIPRWGDWSQVQIRSGQPTRHRAF